MMRELVSPGGRCAAMLALLLGVVSARSLGAAAAEADLERPRATKNGILIELFTSQGCSSCPPADRYLSELASRDDLEIIPLSFHVDYWNYIGWTDPFSSSAWSDRQRRYARVWGVDRIYTPQIVVDGRWEGVGSNRAEVSSLIEQARALSTETEIELGAESLSKNRVRISIAARGFESARASGPAAVWAALVESGLETAVGRGENASKNLHNDRVVRRLERVTNLEAVGPRVAVGTIVLPVESDWRRDRLSVVAFVQDAETLRVEAAAELSLAR